MKKFFYDISETLMGYDDLAELKEKHIDNLETGMIYKFETTRITYPDIDYSNQKYCLKYKGAFIKSSILYFSKILKADLFDILLGKPVKSLDRTFQKELEEVFNGHIERETLFILQESVMNGLDWAKAYRRGKAIKAIGTYIILYQDRYIKKPVLTDYYLPDLELYFHSSSFFYSLYLGREECKRKSYDYKYSKLTTIEKDIPSYLLFDELEKHELDRIHEERSSDLSSKSYLDKDCIIESFAVEEIALLEGEEIDELGSKILLSGIL